MTGEVGVTAERFGHVDPVDVFRFEPLADQDVEVTLAFAEIDPVELGANDLEVEIRDVATDALLASTSGGTPPRSTSFSVSGGAAYDVLVRCEAGHSAYVLSLRSTDPAGGAVVAKAGVETRAGPRRAARLPQDCAGTHVLVRLRAGADERALAARFDLRLGRRTALGTWRMRFPEALAPAGRAGRIAAWCERLAADEAVLSVEPDWFVRPQAEPVEPNDPEYARQWNLRVVGAPGAWSVTQGDPDVVVGVIDTGVVDHPDLEGQVVDGYDFISEPSIAGDGDGRDPDPTDVGARDRPSGRSSWHGTHVAALVAGRANDGYGITGLAPGCRVMPLRAVGIGGGLVSDVADAILYAAALYTTEDGHGLSEPLRVLNLSFAVDLDVEELRTACSRAANVGVLLVGTTGNTGLGVLYPARYDSVLAVAAVDRMLETTALLELRRRGRPVRTRRPRVGRRHGGRLARQRALCPPRRHRAPAGPGRGLPGGHEPGGPPGRRGRGAAAVRGSHPHAHRAPGLPPGVGPRSRAAGLGPRLRVGRAAGPGGAAPPPRRPGHAQSGPALPVAPVDERQLHRLRGAARAGRDERRRRVPAVRRLAARRPTTAARGSPSRTSWRRAADPPRWSASS